MLQQRRAATGIQPAPTVAASSSYDTLPRLLRSSSANRRTCTRWTRASPHGAVRAGPPSLPHGLPPGSASAPCASAVAPPPSPPSLDGPVLRDDAARSAAASTCPTKSSTSAAVPLESDSSNRRLSTFWRLYLSESYFCRRAPLRKLYYRCDGVGRNGNQKIIGR